jgi:hypothetical protein
MSYAEFFRELRKFKEKNDYFGAGGAEIIIFKDTSCFLMSANPIPSGRWR